jgi:hypothetical protein
MSRPRPAITSAPARIGYGQTVDVSVAGPASDIDSVVLVRNPSVTHLVDADQRNVILKVLSRSGSTLQLAAPPSGDVAPPGPYMLFVNRKDAKGLVPSVSRQVFVGLGGLERRAHPARHARAS